MRFAAVIALMLLFGGCGPPDGPYVDRYPGGQPKEEGFYKGGKKTGAWVFYWQNGAKKVEGSYVDDQPHGLWRFYDEQGRQMAQGTYRNGKMWDGRFVRYVFGTQKIIVVQNGQQVN